MCGAVGPQARGGGGFNSVMEAVPGVGMGWSYKETISKLFLLAEG